MKREARQLELAFAEDRAFEPGPDDLERWLPIPGWPGYEVSDWGRVLSYWKRGAGGGRATGIALTPKIVPYHVSSDGYHRINLGRNLFPNREYLDIGVHILVLETFVGPRPRALMACHNDGNPGNNRLENLRWDTASANQLDKVRQDRHGIAQLKMEAIPGIWERLVAGDSPTEIARRLGFSRGIISKIKTGKTWSHITSKLPGWPIMDADRNDKKPVPMPLRFARSTKEFWRPVPGWPLYRVSNWGQVQSCWGYVKGEGRGKRTTNGPWRDVKLSVGSRGYLRFTASNPGSKQKILNVHQCVLNVFAGPCPSGLVGCHNDGDRLNNHAGNLRWDTPAANARDRVRHAMKQAQ